MARPLRPSRLPSSFIRCESSFLPSLPSTPPLLLALFLFFFFIIMGPTALASFADLPNELSSRIIGLACKNATSGEAAASSSPIIDVPTLLNLILVSRHLYPILVEKLYRRVRITTISALRSLASALVSRPALGRCIKSLHFGPEDNLPEDWTPIVYEARGEGKESEGVMCLATSLGHQPGDTDRLPRWCLPRQHWPAEGSATSVKTGSFSSCRHQAIVEAIQSAVTTLNVAPGRPHEGASGEDIGRVSRKATNSKTALRMQAAVAAAFHPSGTSGRLGRTTVDGAGGAGSLPRSFAQARRTSRVESAASPRPA